MEERLFILIISMDFVRVFPNGEGGEQQPEHFRTNLCLSVETIFNDCARMFRIEEYFFKIILVFISIW
jgi:hypothetical protein